MKKGIIISFTGIGYSMGGIQKEEFQKIKSFRNYDSLFVIDENRSWFNTVNPEQIIEKVNMYENVITLGNSMGAFNAIMFAKYYPVKTAIAFATQYSLHPDIVPWENRWTRWQKDITEWKHPHLEFNDTTEYHIIQGDEPMDMKHLDMIPDKPNINKMVIEGASHNVAIKLLTQNKLYQLIERITV